MIPAPSEMQGDSRADALARGNAPASNPPSIEYAALELAPLSELLASHMKDGAPSTVQNMVDVVRAMLTPLLRDGATKEAIDLVAAVLEQPRFWPSMFGRNMVSGRQVTAIAQAAARRARGAPFAYAVRTSAYRYLTLTVDERVLIPRQETEMLVDLILATPQGAAGGTVADIGTGSGAIALALASEGRFDRIIATDVSTDALDVAMENARRLSGSLKAVVEFRVGDALAPLSGDMVDVLVSNPPYIAFAELPELPATVRDWEPPQALVCPDDGLAVTQAVVRGAAAVIRAGGLLAFEVDSRRAHRVAEMVEATASFGNIRVIQDLTARERFVLATRLTFD